jgi:UDP-N-acetylglucosamine transferase subunit ALG13
MKAKVLFLSAVLVLTVCAPYKQLKPKPELSFAEQGYIELKHGEKDFELKKEKKYFITFPAPQEDHFYIVLTNPAKKKMTSFMTPTFTDNKSYGAKLVDESPYPDTMSVYPVDTKSPFFYWLIEMGSEDCLLHMKYRYAPQWRFKFETKHALYRETMKKNVVDRSAYKAIGSTLQLDGFNFVAAMDSIRPRLAALDTVHKELLAIESIFPARIVNSKDEAYQNYRSLKSALEDEMKFQKAYLACLDFFNKERASRGNPTVLISNLDDFIAYFGQKSILSPAVLTESQRHIKSRLEEVVPFYNMRISGKEDAGAFDSTIFYTNALPRIKKLYENADIAIPQEFSLLAKFAGDFDTKARTTAALKESLDHITKQVKDAPQFPPDDVFKGIVTQMSALVSNIPQKIDEQYGKYQTYKCAQILNDEIAKLNAAATTQLGQYRQAEALVQQLNILKAQSDFGTMLSMLNQNKQLGFLLDKYRDLDRMSLDQQARAIRASLSKNEWKQAETGLRKLHADENYLNLSAIHQPKEIAVLDLEDSLYTGIDKLTRARVNKFLEEKIGVVENVDSLYTDSVFLPAYDVTFSSGGKKELVQRKNALIADLARMKENEFPAKAIKLCYEQFIKTPDDNGVLKARAIVTHGNHYKGEDKEIKLRIAECNPMSSKWITKPKEYRRIFALPVTDNRKGKNKYYIRLNVNIPTEANFPVYDVNIKLPKEVAQNAATAQWYDEISLNKKLLKNEGRFSISAPGASNDYECQITPVQMNKDANNILEVTFTHHSFKPFIVSVMVQKPIIKKN